MSENPIYDHVFKIIVVGDTAVGKTSILTRYADDDFVVDHKTTLGVDFKIRTMEIRDKRIKLQLWDTAGQERWSGLASCYYRGARGVIYTFALNNMQSFIHIDDWVESVSSFNVPFSILVGNKCDLKDKRVVQKESIREVCERHSLTFVETSAKHNTNVHEAFNMLATGILDMIEEANIKKEPTDTKDKVIREGTNVLEMDEDNKKCNC